MAKRPEVTAYGAQSERKKRLRGCGYRIKDRPTQFCELAGTEQKEWPGEPGEGDREEIDVEMEEHKVKEETANDFD
ncbi:hypothetical protein DPEC_G00034990 [Dallia pectoralis]|uniref:Uncharacterized protein n=1 Tax=Dallia pectoralis TaxID=75939 RepID=A0ACC2HD64_DALPE|nr:hypothetical protein DPEC_G00034990 [Dallia pectoralis]